MTYRKALPRLLAVVTMLAMLAAFLALPVSASSLDMSLEMSLDPPENYDDREFYEFEDYVDMSSGYVGLINEGGVYYEYVYLKEEDYDPHFTVEFEIETPGTYDFLIECMAYSTQIPRTSILQIDDGELIYITSFHGDRHLVTEYYTGLTAELEPGTHTMSVYLAEDFDNVNVKSLFFDCFSFINLTPPAEVTETETETETEPETEAPTEAPTEAQTGAATDGATEAPTQGAANPPKEDAGCASTIGLSALLLVSAAAFVARKRED